MPDNRLEVDEARRVARHETVKSEVEREVNNEIVGRADRAKGAQVRTIDAVAGELRGKAVGEVVEAEREVDRGRSLARVSQFVDYGFSVLYALLAIRLLLALMAARSSSGFVQFITAVTDPFYQPFRGIVASPSLESGHTLVLPLVIAIVVYALAHAGINGMLRLGAHRKTSV